MLAKLFSSSNIAPRKRPMVFDPTADSMNLEQQRKKSVVRPVTRDFVFFPEYHDRVPKTALSEEGRVKSIVFKRTMTPLQVQSLIQRSFASISHEGAFSFLVATKDNKLVESPVPEPSGDDISSKRGIIYIYRSRKQVCLSIIHSFLTST